MSIRVLIADDQALIRAGFRAVIDSAEDLTVVAEAANGREAIDLARQCDPDVVLMDIRRPEMDGLAATRAIVSDPALASSRILILTTFEIEEYVFEALRAGASGFLSKSVEPADLLAGIRVIARGDSLLSPVATKNLIAKVLAQPHAAPGPASDMFDSLTEREREIVSLVATGLSNDDIARQLVISPFTVKTHANRAMAKLGVRDRAQLVVRAYQAGLVQPRA
jgi:DNA-binding NarL/FixJ family response regulator